MAGCCLVLEVKHTKYIAFIKPVRGDDCVQVSLENGTCARMVSYSSLEDWAGCCRWILVSECSRTQNHRTGVCTLG